MKKPDLTRPNVIIVNVDDLGYADVGCYGSEKNKTPNIDKLAQDGVMFTDFYASSPVCSPSRAGLLTGCYPKRVDFQLFDVYDPACPEQPKDKFVVLMPGQPQGLNPSETTIAQVFKKADYATKAIGKWHVGDQEEFSPLRFGFDSYFGIPYSNDMGLQTPAGIFERMKYTICPLPLMENEQVIEEQPDMPSVEERYTCEAVKFIRENKDRPFFLYLAHSYVHHPLYVSRAFEQKANDVFGAAVAAVDWSVGVLVRELQKLGLENNTLIAFTSDNGGDLRSSNKPFRGHKGDTLEGGQRVDCIIKWPAAAKGGRVCRELATNMDFFHTAAEITGVDICDGVKRDGHSLLRLLMDEKATTAYEAFCYFRQNDLEAVRKGKYKLDLKNRRLYDLSQDVAEERDLSSELPDKVREIEEIARRYREDLGDDYTGTKGKNCRSKGFVKNFSFRTCKEEDYPYMIALYD